MKSLLRSFAIIITSLFIIPHITLAFTIPEATGLVVDTAGMLSNTAELKTELEQVKKESGIEVAVVTIPSLNDELTIEEAAEKIFNTWKIGNATKDNGVLLLISKADRKFRIEAGYSTEGVLTDLTSKKILNGMTPFFKAGKFDEGVKYAVGEIIYTLNQDPSLRVEGASETSSSEGGDGIFALFAIILFNVGGFIFVWISSIFAKSKSWYLGGIMGGIIGVLGLLFGLHWIFIIILSIIGFIWDYLVSSEYKTNGSKSAWWAGGSSFSGGSSSSSSSSSDSWGGFGGGSSGGGGASGGW